MSGPLQRHGLPKATGAKACQRPLADNAPDVSKEPALTTQCGDRALKVSSNHQDVRCHLRPWAKWTAPTDTSTHNHTDAHQTHKSCTNMRPRAQTDKHTQEREHEERKLRMRRRTRRKELLAHNCGHHRKRMSVCRCVCLCGDVLLSPCRMSPANAARPERTMRFTHEPVAASQLQPLAMRRRVTSPMCLQEGVQEDNWLLYEMTGEPLVAGMSCSAATPGIAQPTSHGRNMGETQSDDNLGPSRHRHVVAREPVHAPFCGRPSAPHCRSLGQITSRRAPNTTAT